MCANKAPPGFQLSAGVVLYRTWGPNVEEETCMPKDESVMFLRSYEMACWRFLHLLSSVSMLRKVDELCRSVKCGEDV